MKSLTLVVMMTMLSMNIYGQSQSKMKFTITGCHCTTNEKDWFPCKSNLVGRFVTYNQVNEKWVLYLNKTEEYRIIDGKPTSAGGLDSIIYQVVDSSNKGQVIIYTELDTLAILMVMKSDYTSYNLKPL